MTREDAKNILPIIEAYAKGKTIQIRDNEKRTWFDITNDINISNLYAYAFNYRIKPELSYRPFKNAKECLNEIQKHRPIGWIKSKDEDEGPYYSIYCNISDNNLFESDFIEFTFADGTPFGIKEE